MKTFLLITTALATMLPMQAQPIEVGASARPAPAAAKLPVPEKLALVLKSPLAIEHYVEPYVPATFVMDVMRTGRVRIAVQTDEKGRPVDSVILAYSHRRLADNTIDALDRWRFTPVKVEGVPVAARTEIELEFKGADVISITNVGDQFERMLNNMGVERLEFQPCPLTELDRIPLPLNTIPPRYSIAARDQGVVGTVEVQFYIDQTGTVRLPAVISADRIDLAEAAFEAVQQWKFEPPTRKGIPVLISAMQQFKFGLDEASPSMAIK